MAKQNSKLVTSCMGGWLYTWYLQYKFYTSESNDIWSYVGNALTTVQTAAILEIVHSMLGFVRSPVMTTTLQVFSRVLLVWGYARICPETHTTIGIRLMILSWSLVEVPRYLFYVVKLLDIKMPTWLLFLRYNLFIVLYPTGITGEMLTMYNSLNFIKKTHIYSIALPNAWNVAFDYYTFTIMILLIYIPLGPFMIQNMISQRKKNWVDAMKAKSD